MTKNKKNKSIKKTASKRGSLFLWIDGGFEKSELTVHADDAAENYAVDWTAAHGDMVRCFCDDELTVFSKILRRDEKQVVLGNAILLHAVIRHAQYKRFLMRAEHFLREGEDGFAVLFGEQRRIFVMRGNHRYGYILAPWAFIENIDGTRLRRVALDHAVFFETCQIAVYGRTLLEADGLTDFPHRRRIPLLEQEGLDELENLFLTFT